ncbi:MAG: DNA ligase [Arenicella sp.]|nr:DNA ligase [Arenicella sp.]
MKFLVLLFFLLELLFSIAAAETRFSFLLASSFDPQKHSLDDYFLSEKLDGVRVYWDGSHLNSRGGKQFAAPQWFLESLPSTPLDGELWGGRQTFDEVSGLVRRSKPHEGWRKITLMVFELPQAKGDFSARYQQMQRLHAQHGNQYWQVVEQREAPNTLESLRALLLKLNAEGGEGFMLKSKVAAYRGGRSDDLLKIKLKNDAEAQVIAHNKGKGRLAAVMGSITVQMPSGIQFKIGSGFSDAQRKNPPPVGTVVTYKYNGLTKNGKPRFPVFWRVRN